jgi:DNA-binding transcriptional LysR family regulator
MDVCRAEAETEPVLSVGIDPGVAGGLIGAALREFAVWHPGSRVCVESVSHGADGATVSQRADLALVCAGPAADPSIERYVVCSEEVGVVLAAGHPAAASGAATLAQLSREPQLKALYGSRHWHSSLSVSGLTGLRLDWAAGYDKYADGLDLVSSGRGIMLVPRVAWEGSQRDDLEWIPVPDAGSVALMVAWRPDRSSSLARAFAKFVVESARLRRVDARHRANGTTDAAVGHRRDA